MKRFTIPCDFNGRKAPFNIYIGDPSSNRHPLHYQAMWLRSQRGGIVPQEVMDSFKKLHNIALENKVSFEDLCVYALGQAAQEQNARKIDEDSNGPDGAAQ